MSDIIALWHENDLCSTRQFHGVLQRAGWDCSWSQTVHELRAALGMDISAYRRKQGGRYDEPDDAPSPDIMRSLSPSNAALQQLADNGRMRWNKHLEKLRKLNRWGRLFFNSDEHLPYQDDAAIELALKVCADFNPDVITGLNDKFDMQAQSRFDDPRATFQRVWDGDVQNVINAHAGNMAGWRDAAPNAAVIALPGNHDLRLISYLHRGSTTTADFTLKEVLGKLIDHGLVWLGGETVEVELSPGLVIMHGRYATKRIHTTLQNTLESFAFQRSVVVGHVHRMGQYTKRGYDYDVVGHASGCLCQLQPHYSAFRQDWQQGVVLGHFDPNGKHAQLYNVRFLSVRGHLTAFWAGREYRVRLPGQLYAVTQARAA